MTAWGPRVLNVELAARACKTATCQSMCPRLIFTPLQQRCPSSLGKTFCRRRTKHLISSQSSAFVAGSVDGVRAWGASRMLCCGRTGCCAREVADTPRCGQASTAPSWASDARPRSPSTECGPPQSHLRRCFLFSKPGADSVDQQSQSQSRLRPQALRLPARATQIFLENSEMHRGTCSGLGTLWGMYHAIHTLTSVPSFFGAPRKLENAEAVVRIRACQPAPSVKELHILVAILGGLERLESITKAQFAETSPAEFYFRDLGLQPSWSR